MQPLYSQNREELGSNDSTEPSAPDSLKRKAYSPAAATEDENLRSACDSCTYSKIRCLGGRPCARCKKRGQACVFSEKRRCGPKRRGGGEAGVSGSVGPASSNGVGSSSAPCIADYVRFVPSTMETATLNPCEKEWLRQFVVGLNAFLPIVSESTLNHAVKALPGTATEVEKQRRHACRAVLWGSVALGALVTKHEAEAVRYNQRARLELKECFDASVSELTSVFLVLSIYYLHRLDNPKLVRYAGFARQSLREMPFVPPDLAASVRMLQVSLYLAGAGEPPDVPVPPPRSAVTLASSAAKQRSLHILAFLMMSIYTQIRPDEQRPGGTVAVVGDEHLLSLASEISGLADCCERADDMTAVIGSVLHGYLLLRSGHVREAITMSEEVAGTVADNPLILQFPLTWTMSCCVLEGLRRFGRHAVAERLIAAMTPLAAALPFASKCCSVGAELLAVYAGNTGFVAQRASAVMGAAGGSGASGGAIDYAMLQASTQSQQLSQLRQTHAAQMHHLQMQQRNQHAQQQLMQQQYMQQYQPQQHQHQQQHQQHELNSAALNSLNSSDDAVRRPSGSSGSSPSMEYDRLNSNRSASSSVSNDKQQQQQQQQHHYQSQEQYSQQQQQQRQYSDHNSQYHDAAAGAGGSSSNNSGSSSSDYGITSKSDGSSSSSGDSRAIEHLRMLSGSSSSNANGNGGHGHYGSSTSSSSSNSALNAPLQFPSNAAYAFTTEFFGATQYTTPNMDESYLAMLAGEAGPFQDVFSTAV